MSSLGSFDYPVNYVAPLNLHRGTHITIALRCGEDVQNYRAVVKSRYRLRNGNIRIKFLILHKYSLEVNTS